MLPDTLCVGDATSPGLRISFKVTTPIFLSLEPWTLVQITTAPNTVDNPPSTSSFPPVPTHYHALRLLSTFLPPAILSFDYSSDCCFPPCFFSFLPLFMIFTRDLTAHYLSRQPNDPSESERSATGADVKGVGVVCRVETKRGGQQDPCHGTSASHSL